MSDETTITYIRVHVPTKKGGLETVSKFSTILDHSRSFPSIKTPKDLIAHWNSIGRGEWVYHLIQPK